MKGDYPRFRASYAHDDLVVHFLPTHADLELIARCRGDVNRFGVAILLKALPYLGYFPHNIHAVPCEVQEFIVRQLNLPGDSSTARLKRVSLSQGPVLL